MKGNATQVYAYAFMLLPFWNFLHCTKLFVKNSKNSGTKIAWNPVISRNLRDFTLRFENYAGIEGKWTNRNVKVQTMFSIKVILHVHKIRHITDSFAFFLSKINMWKVWFLLFSLSLSTELWFSETICTIHFRMSWFIRAIFTYFINEHFAWFLNLD